MASLTKKQDWRPVLQAPYRQIRKANSVLGDLIICGTVWMPKVLETNLEVRVMNGIKELGVME